MSPVRSRRLVGNLDFEESLVGGDRPALSLRVRRGLSAIATLLRALAAPSDRLWTPHRVDAVRLPTVPGVPPVRLESGPLESVSPAVSATLAWGETETVARIRAAGENATEADRTGEPPPKPGAPLSEQVWRGPIPTAEAARRVNHRGFGLALAGRLGLALPGVRMVSSPGELEAHLRAGGASPAGDRWVLKGTYSAAGRDRLRGAGRELPTGASLSRAQRLFERHDALLFEPWFERELDVGCAAWVARDEVRLLGLHRQEVDGYGRFRGLTVTTGDPERSLGLDPIELEVLVETAQSVGGQLRESGYLGPFGLDAWRYRDARGARGFHTLGEINARLTIGLLVHALVERLEDADVYGSSFRFRLGREPGRPRSPNGRIIPLLEAGSDDPTLAWIEVC